MNAFWNYLCFRRNDLRLSFFFSAAYTAVAIATFAIAMVADRTAALFFLPYTLYLAYANAWGYAVWKLNSS